MPGVVSMGGLGRGRAKAIPADRKPVARKQPIPAARDKQVLRERAAEINSRSRGAPELETPSENKDEQK